MGVPVLFTDTAGVSELIVVPFPGLFLSDELYLGDDLFLDDGPTLQFYGATPTVTDTGITVAVDAAVVTFSGGDATLPTVTDIIVTVFPEPVTFSGGDATIAGQDLVVSVDAAVVTFSATLPETIGSQLVILVPSVRELPPLRLHHIIRTPSGRYFRWAEDDPNPSNVPSAVRFSDTMPGGFETGDAVLPRKSSDDSRDLERLSDWTIAGAGGEVAWQGRLERAPRTSGDQVSVSPSGVGWQANLDDDKSARMVYVDRDLTNWRGMSAARNDGLPLTSYSPQDGSVSPDVSSGRSSLSTAFTGAWGPTSKPIVESWYDAHVAIGRLVYAWSKGTNVAQGDTNWAWTVGIAVGDGMSGAVDTPGNLRALGPGSGSLGATSTNRRFAFVQHRYDGGGPGGDNVQYAINWTCLAVYGVHELPTYGVVTATSAPGVLASDVVTHAVGKFAPALNVSSRSVQPSGFVIEQMAFLDPTTAGEIVKQATRFGLQDWAVWNDKTFWFHDRGAHGRKWRLRVGPANLQETGQAVDRVWESVIVQYDDVDGTTRTVGPPGSGADIEDPVLKDSDPTNPANEAGLIRRDLLSMGTSTAAAATEIGRRFLEESKRLDGSGQASVTGHATDDHGVLYPYWAMRAGDTAVFVDAADTSERRIVRTDKDHSTRTCNLDLDAPPEGLQALLERLGVTLVPLGIS